MYEHLRNAFITKLSIDYGRQDINKISSILDGIAKDYSITEKCTELTVYTEAVPQELKDYLAGKSIEGCSPKTIRLYGRFLRTFFYDLKKPLKDITTNDIRIYLATYKQVRKITDRTLDKYREILNSFFAWLTDEEYIEKNPCRTIKPIKYEVIPRKAMTRLQLETLRRRCKDPRDLAIVDLLYSTAFRVDELSHLKLSDIDFEHRTAHTIGKGNKHNTVYINDNAYLSLMDYLKTRKGDNDYVFLTLRSPYRRLSTRSIEQLVKNYEAAVGCKLTPHIIRHTTATLSLKAGMSITQVQKMLNHASVSTTQIYAETSLEDVLQAEKRYVV